MITEALDEDREFGIVLIERGPAEGSDNVRSDLGTVARIVRHETLDDGRMLILGVGTAASKSSIGSMMLLIHERTSECSLMSIRPTI